MKLRELLQELKEIIEENPEALDMEIFTTNGSSGVTSPLSNPYVCESDEDMKDFFGVVGSYIDFYNGN